MIKNLLLNLCLFAVLIWLAACWGDAPPESSSGQQGRLIVVTSTPTVAAAVPTPLLTPTAASVTVAATCADIDAYWGQDWPVLLDVLAHLIEAGQSCGAEPLPAKKYAAHYIYGVSLEDQGNAQAAIEQYRAALLLDPQRGEALEALFRLKALPSPTPPACLSDSPPRPDPPPSGALDAVQRVTVNGSRFELAGRPFTVKGLNYYPRRAPWQRFLTEVTPADIAAELDLIQQAGFNTIRIFLWYQPLFTCQPEDAIPNEAAFARLDALFEAAQARNLKVIATLNDLPDLTFRPLYTDWDHYDAQTTYLVRRYSNQPALLAWDVRNGGNHDYGPKARFSEEEVNNWLAHITGLIRANDPHHLLTAGWDDDPALTAPHVDFLSFQHWDSADSLPARLADFRETGDKPLLLLATGFPGWAEAEDVAQAEKAQAEQLVAVISAAQQEKLAGWVVWTAFDFELPPGQPAVDEFFFGLWRTDLTPKPALARLPLK